MMQYPPYSLYTAIKATKKLICKYEELIYYLADEFFNKGIYNPDMPSEVNSQRIKINLS